MPKGVDKSDIILMITALLALILSEVLYFSNYMDEALFVGLWVPTILGFACILKLIKMSK